MAWAWLGALGLVVVLGAAVVLWPLRLDVSGRARGEADGRWFVAGGASLAALALTFVWARGVPPQLSVLLFGRKLTLKSRPRPKPKPSEKRGRTRGARWLGRLDPLDFALQALEERRHLRLRYLTVDLTYGFRDPLLTGRLVGAIAALSAVLPSRVQVRQSPRWDFEDGWEIAVDGRAFVRPWLMALDLSAYVVRRLARRTPQAGPSRGPRPSEAR